MTELDSQFNVNKLNDVYKGKNKRGPSRSSLIWIEHQDGLIIEVLPAFNKSITPALLPKQYYNVFLITQLGLRYEIAVITYNLDLVKLTKYNDIIIEKDWIENSLKDLITFIRIYDVHMT